MSLKSVSLLIGISIGLSRCPNNCSGHGKCIGADSICDCYSGWGASTDIAEYRSLDCSSRTCPSNLAWAQLPGLDGNAHETLKECSGKGKATIISAYPNDHVAQACVTDPQVAASAREASQAQLASGGLAPALPTALATACACRCDRWRGSQRKMRCQSLCLTSRMATSLM
jgi:hypothetical protein